MNTHFDTVIAADPGDRQDAFEQAAQRLGTSAIHIEKDFWVCWMLDQLFNSRAENEPRLLFKGGTSLSKGFSLINRFSEDIDVTVFRTDLAHGATFDELDKMSRKKRDAELAQIKDDCSAYIQGPLQTKLATLASDAMTRAGIAKSAWKIESDAEDEEVQSLLFWYPQSVPADRVVDGYVRRAVLIESGAKSALDPNITAEVIPYVAKELPDLNLVVPNIVMTDPRRTFWDKVIVLHGQRQWFESEGEFKGGGNRLTRHYYDLHQMLQTKVGSDALADRDLGLNVARHAKMFFNRGKFNLDLAIAGKFTIAPTKGMIAPLEADYAQMTPMVFGHAPSFGDVMASIEKLHAALEDGAAPSLK